MKGNRYLYTYVYTYDECGGRENKNEVLAALHQNKEP